MAPKRYDRAYFTRWYHDPRTRVDTAASLARKVALAVGAAEYLLGRPIRSVLDVGCGEGRWQPVVRHLRPRAHYLGVDASEYAVARFGRRRNLRLGRIGELAALDLDPEWDLVVCADLLQYVPNASIVPALAELRGLTTGVAYIEAFATEDRMEGDRAGWHERSAAQYRRIFRRAGFTHCGFYCWVDAEQHPAANVFELDG